MSLASQHQSTTFIPGNLSGPDAHQQQPIHSSHPSPLLPPPPCPALTAPSTAVFLQMWNSSGKILSMFQILPRTFWQACKINYVCIRCSCTSRNVIKCYNSCTAEMRLQSSLQNFTLTKSEEWVISSIFWDTISLCHTPLCLLLAATHSPPPPPPPPPAAWTGAVDQTWV